MLDDIAQPRTQGCFLNLKKKRKSPGNKVGHPRVAVVTWVFF